VGRDLAITGGNDMGRPSTVETADGGVTAVGVARLATAMLMAAAAERTADECDKEWPGRLLQCGRRQRRNGRRW
jgi:hypothetical protein